MHKVRTGLLAGLFLTVLVGSAAQGQQPRITFSASFENGAGAEIAKGDPRPVLNKKNFEFSDGISGRSILTGPQTPLVYQAVKNIDPNAGTLSFWVQPVDWNVKKKGWYPLFWLGTGGGNVVHYILFLNVLDSGCDLSFSSRCDGKEYKAQMFGVNSELPNVFKRGEWTHIVCTWTNWQCFLYVNGKQTAQLSYGLPIKSMAVPDNFDLWFAGTNFWTQELNYRTRLDQIEIYDGALTASQIKEKYLSASSNLAQKIKATVVPIPRSDKKVVVDGRVTAAEWSDASQVPLNRQLFQLQFVPRPAWCQIKYDDVNLYVAVEVETPNRLVTPASGRDVGSKRVFEGDCFEILIRPPGHQGKDDPYFQLGVGANGAWALFKNGVWKEPTAIQKAVVATTGRGWSAEIAIPLTELYVKPVPGDPWLLQLAVDSPSDEDIPSPQDRLFAWSSRVVEGLNKYTVMYRDPQAMGRAIFQKDNTFFRMERSGNLNLGQLDLVGAGAGTVQSRVRVESPEKTVLDRSAAAGQTLAIKEKFSFLGPGLLTVEGTKKGQDRPIYVYQTLFNVKDPLTVSQEFYADESSVVLSLDAAGLDDHLMRKLQGPGLMGEARMITAEKNSSQSAGPKLYGRTTFTLKSISQKVKLPFQDLPPGRYQIVVTLTSEDRTVTRECLFERPNPEFLTKKYGVDRTVPAPWTPVQVLEGSPSTVKVIGRTYTFGDIGLPATAESFGRKVLSRPVSFQATLDGEPRSFIAQSQVTQEKAGDRVVTTGTAKTPDGSITMNWTRTIEFDGMILYRIDLIPAAGKVRLEGLKLKMVVPAESARYLMKPDCIADWNKTGRHTSMPTNYFWLTGIHTGMDFFTPDDGNWVYTEKDPPVSIVRKDRDVELTCRFITRPVQVSKPLRYTFGFMATPVKPLKKNWRAVHADGWGFPKGQTLQDYWCYDEKSQRIQFPNLELLTEMTYEKEGMVEIAEWHKKGIKIVPVALHQCMPDNNPYYDYYGTVWASTTNGRDAKSFRSKWQGKEFYMCCSACPAGGFGDFLSWCVYRMVNKYGFDGVYLDGSATGQCDNARHGCGFVDAFGRQIHPWNDLGARESFKCLYKIIHKKVPDGFLYVHCQAMLAPHIESLVDLVLPGEDLMPNVPGNPKYYTDGVPLERWQSSYNIANLMGTMATFDGLSQPADVPLNRAPTDPNISRPLMTMCLLHDATLHGNFIYCKTIEKYWQVFDETGISAGQAEFVGYWYPEAKIKAGDPKVLVSYYRWPDGKKTVLVIGNPSPETRETQLRIPTQFLRSGNPARDAFTGKLIDLNKPIKMEDRSFLVVVLKSRE